MLRDLAGFRKIILKAGRTDLRKGIDGLSAIIRGEYGLDPLEEGTLFLFCGRKRTTIKGLLYEGDGFVLLTKRASNGYYQWPRTTNEAMALSKEEFKRFIEGYTIESTLHKYRRIMMNGEQI